MTAGRVLVLTPRHRARSTQVTADGVLDVGNYPTLRDGLLKIAAETEDGLIVDVDGLAIGEASLCSVFSLVAMRINDWPAVPFALVSRRPGQVELLSRRAVDRFVPVHETFDVAESAFERHFRRRAEQHLLRADGASTLARRFVTRVCAEWDVPDLVDDATLIATELVENTIRHTRSLPRLRLELRHGMLAVAVADDDPRPAVLLERLSLLEPGLGLRMVAQTARVWGSSPSWSGGKVVWAVLPRPRASRGGPHVG